MSGERVGFTGTRNPITPQQRAWLYEQLSSAFVLHHGACENADEEAHYAAIRTGGYHVTVHPPKDPTHRMSLDGLLRSDGNLRGLPNSVTTLPSKDFLDRDRDIVDATSVLLALPDGPERPRSGTWYTVRYARRRSVPVRICYPDGTLGE